MTLFPAPEGTQLVSALATGTLFHAAVVRDGEALRVCKRLLPRMRDEPAARAAMAREGLALGRAAHASLPSIHRVGSDAHGPFLLESLFHGVSLRALVEGWRDRGKPVPPRLVAHVATAAAEALAGVHELEDDRGQVGLSHGDLGPDHVILGPIGEIRFVDFGAARFTGMDPALATSDRGTLPYAAPEVARGEVPPDQAADVYALAATLLHVAASGPICSATGDAAMLLEIGERGLSPALCDRATGLSQGGRDALRRAIALSPKDRLVSARALADALASSAPC